MIKIFHNNRCMKSRLGIKFLEENELNFEIINYLDNPLSLEEIKIIVKKLKIKPIELVRKNETIWKSNYKNKELSDEEIVTAMVNYPKLIERPIVINGDKAIIGRPAEKILDII